VSAWESWSELHQAYVGPWRDLVHHSGRVLQALSFAPTGAICAAATTSLPEAVGGARNWDYRYAWVRDAYFTIEALGGGGLSRRSQSVLRLYDFLRGRLA
jgi:alpha,alpha-trehalase